MRDHTLAIKGNRDGIVIATSPTEEWMAVMSDLAARIDTQNAFFNGARVTLDVGPRPVRKDELMSVKALLERRGLVLWMVSSASITTIEAAEALDLRADYTGAHPEHIEEPEDGVLPFNNEEAGTSGVMIRRTLRSGRVVRSQGHVVVFGDVNQGAEIVAAGDIIIWGRLRGNVHAGATGDETAVVCALDMTPTQLRIASYISVSPPDKRRKPKPETALIRDNQIIVEPWN